MTFSPLRYPGGKAKIYNNVKKLINQNFIEKPVYVEGFAGGSGLALKLLLTGIVTEIHINDLDTAIYSFWDSVLNKTSDLISLIQSTPVTVAEWHRQKDIYIKNKNSISLELGFATLFLNRTNRSGILNAGPIGGYTQKGNFKINCRFNKDKLIEVINKIHNNKSKIHIYNLDAKDFILAIDKSYTDALIYLDPPYVIQGQNLYLNSFCEKDHFDLSLAVKELTNKWFLTYDNDILIKDLYKNYRVDQFTINYNAQDKRKEVELVIFDNRLNADASF